MPGTTNTKNYYQSFLGNENQKLLMKSKIITHQPKTLQTETFDIKSVFMEHAKTSYKFSMTKAG